LSPFVGKFPFDIVVFGLALSDLVKKGVNRFDAFLKESEFRVFGNESLDLFTPEVGGFAEDEGDNAGFEFGVDVGL
jgi:hypothetical protein